MLTLGLVATLAMAQTLHAQQQFHPTWAVGTWSNSFSFGATSHKSTWTLNKDGTAAEKGAAFATGGWFAYVAADGQVYLRITCSYNDASGTHQGVYDLLMSKNRRTASANAKGGSLKASQPGGKVVEGTAVLTKQ
jgi:hypothetical protein